MAAPSDPQRTKTMLMPARHEGAASDDAHPMLVVVEGLEPGRRFVLQTNATTIGRGAENHVVLPSPAVSHAHARIAARDGRGHAPWWIAPPHHLNYFDFDSLEALLVRLGLRPVERLTSFPMEAFLLMGDDYVADPALGRACHAKRMNFDLAFEAAGIGEVRRRLYGALAAAADALTAHTPASRLFTGVQLVDSPQQAKRLDPRQLFVQP